MYAKIILFRLKHMRVTMCFSYTKVMSNNPSLLLIVRTLHCIHSDLRRHVILGFHTAFVRGTSLFIGAFQVHSENVVGKFS